jgi:glycosidase
MRELIYKPYLNEFKSPVGAVKVNEPFTITIGITETDDIEDVFFVLCKENETPVFYRMQNIGQAYRITMTVTSRGLYSYHFKVNQWGGGYFNIFCGDKLNPEYHYGSDWLILFYERATAFPDLLKGGVIYQIMVDRFNCVDRLKTRDDCVYRDDWGGTPYYLPDENGVVKNNDFFGGNLKGVAAKLDYLASLGVTCIYLNPIFKAYSNHKYDTGSYMSVDPDFGTEKDLRDLIAKAKKLGVSVMLDGVFSHTGDDSEYFNKYGKYDSLGAYQSKSSPYYDWYSFSRYPDEYSCWWGIDILPQVSELNPSYLNYITGNGGVIEKYTALGVSAWRLDVADELPDEFISRLSAAAKRVNPNSLILGEVWEDAVTKVAYGVRRKYFWGDELDSVTNYPFKSDILHYVITGDGTRLAGAVNVIVDHYPKDVLDSLMNVIGTHDTERAITALSTCDRPGSKSERATAQISDYNLAKAKLKVASILQFTLPGVPCIYYGDEAGMQGYEDPFNRKCYPWGEEDRELIDFYARLGKIRRENADVLASGEYVPIRSDKGVFSFRRVSDDGAIYVVANRSEFPLTLEKSAFDIVSEKLVGEVPPNGAIIVRE